jgi:ZIP family zinc transporter
VGLGSSTATTQADRTKTDKRFWVFGLLPLALLALALVLFSRFGTVGVFDAAFPPIEELTIERLSFRPGSIGVHVINGGPESVKIAQVTVDEALWQFTIEPSNQINRLGTATVLIPYPWVEGEPHVITLISASGVVFEAEAPVASLSPTPGVTFFMTFTILGFYVGVIPVFIGLIWFPFLRRLSNRGVFFFLSLTVGLLLFLGADTVAEAIELSTNVAGAFQGIGLAVTGFILAFLAIAVVDRWREARTGARDDGSVLLLTYAIAVGIGLHNLGEGLAIGAAYATGAIALGTFLVVGFAVHNTTEGLAIAAPLARGDAPARRLVPHLLVAGMLAGVPTIFGAWLGGFAFSPIWATFFLSLGAGAIFQVVWQIARMMGGEPDGSLSTGLNAMGVAVGVLIMYGTGVLLLS